MKADKPRKKIPCLKAVSRTGCAGTGTGPTGTTGTPARKGRAKSTEKADKPLGRKDVAPVTAANTWVYFGPNRPYGLPLANRQIFRGGIPAVFATCLAATPCFAACFVPGSELSQALKDTRDNASALAKAGRRVARETLEQRRDAANGAK